MPGHIWLEGGTEFGGQMAAPDTRALEWAGGLDALAGIIPAAAAPDHHGQRAGENGRRWFRRLGARQVTGPALTDRASADAPMMAQALRQCKRIHMPDAPVHQTERATRS